MGLSTELISEFVKITNDTNKGKNDNTIYGTVSTVSQDGKSGTVKIDGSDEATPVFTTCTMTEGDRVRLNIRNHNAIVTGNLSDQSVGVQRATDIEATIKNLGDSLEFQVSNMDGSLASKITMLSNKIESDVLDEEKGLASKITQLSNKIESDVLDEEKGLASKITQNAGSIESIIKDQETFSAFKQTVEGFTFMGQNGTTKISGGDIDLTGAIKFSDLSDATTKQLEIDNACTRASNAETIANNVSNAVDDLTVTEGMFVDGVYVNRTYIDGEMIYSNSIYADAMHLGGSLTVYDSLYSSNVGGYLGYDDGFNSDSGIGIRDSTGGNQVVCTNQAARLSSGDPTDIWTSTYSQFIANQGSAFIDASHAIVFEIAGTSYVALSNHSTYGSLRPQSGALTMNLGNTSYRWGAVYATNGTIQTSDRNYKHDIEHLPDKYITLFDGLIPRRFKMNEGSSGRYHVGYIAQEVEEAMLEAGIDSLEFGGFVRDLDEAGNEICMLRYGEFDGIRDLKIKQLEARLATIEERINA